MLTSSVTLLQRLGVEPAEALQSERALAGVTGRVALERGGPLTRRFVEALPERWLPERVFVDVLLEPVAVGSAPALRQLFHREPWLGRSGEVFDRANAETGVEHVGCIFGPSLPDVLEGDYRVADVPTLRGAGSDLELDSVVARDAWFRMQFAEGRFGLISVSEGRLYRYGPFTWQRLRPAPRGGVHLWMRATFGSRRGMNDAGKPDTSSGILWPTS